MIVPIYKKFVDPQKEITLVSIASKLLTGIITRPPKQSP